MLNCVSIEFDDFIRKKSCNLLFMQTNEVTEKEATWSIKPQKWN